MNTALCPGSGQRAEIVGVERDLPNIAQCAGCTFVYVTAMNEPITARHYPPDDKGLVRFEP